MWQHRRLVAALLLPVMLGTIGCGFILKGTRQTIEVRSAPDGAQVTTQPVTETITTPASLNLERKNNYTLTFSREGYRSATFLITRDLDENILLFDIFYTLLIGVVVDAVTGAWYKLRPETTTVTLLRADDSIDGPEAITVTISEEGKDGAFRIESNLSVDVTVRPRL